MFREQRLLNFETLPQMSRRPRRRVKPSFSPEKKREMYKEIHEKEKEEKEDTVKVAENLIDALEFVGIKCKRCGSKNVKEDRNAVRKDPHMTVLYCIDCKYRWEDLPTQANGPLLQF